MFPLRKRAMRWAKKITRKAAQPFTRQAQAAAATARKNAATQAAAPKTKAPRTKLRATDLLLRPFRTQTRRGADLLSLTASVDGTEIHAVESPGKGKPGIDILLIHGAGLDHRDWTFSFIDALRRALGSRPRILAVDRPGFGRSQRPRASSSALPSAQARLLRGAAKSWGLRRLALIGHSWGGAVASAWAVQDFEARNTDASTERGPQIEALTSIAGAILPWSAEQNRRNAERLADAARIAMLSGGFTAAGMGRAARAAMTDAFAPNTPPEGYFEHVATQLSPTSGPAAATMADIAAINGALALQAAKLSALATPTALIYGEDDAVLSLDEQGLRAAAMMPNAALTRLSGVGHMAHHAAEAVCVETVRRLLRGIE